MPRERSPADSRVINSAPALLLVFLATSAPVTAAIGSAVCATCHADIYRRYMRTPMATSSGRVGIGDFQEKFDRSKFFHPPSGVRYRVNRTGNTRSFDFELADGGVSIRGSRNLEYFIGSGRVGRSYLFSIDSFLYQAPVSYYSAASKWDLSPGYQSYNHLYLTRPIEADCLQCHASRVQPTTSTLNGFAAVPFLEGGIGCERCHGAGERHIARIKSASTQGGSEIINPQKLPPEHRDSVCAQCHLSGVARIRKAGRNAAAFQPGALLSDSVSVFVWSSAAAEMKVTSHFEKLAQSACKLASGDRLWCGSCHDPHSPPTEKQKVSYFRGKCLECHTATFQCKAAPALRARNANSCIECHMPKNPVVDVAHAVYTDHSIPRRAAAPVRPAGPFNGILTVFGGKPASDRELGLAYASVIESEPNPSYAARALELLTTAATQDPNDVPALVQLGNLYGSRSDEERAIEFYERAVRADPNQVVAANNLAAYLMKRGRIDEAIRLWSNALARSPGFEAARMNLAVAQFRAAKPERAEATLMKGLELNPGAIEMRKMAAQFHRPKTP